MIASLVWRGHGAKKGIDKLLDLDLEPWWTIFNLAFQSSVWKNFSSTLVVL
jgi:hypothetical protein